MATRGITRSDAATRPRLPGILLGIGLGGFADGIVLHEILQWHHILSSEGSYPKTTIAGLKDNTLADGTFLAATWVITVVGLWILWRRTNEWRWAASGRALVGWILVGWARSTLLKESSTTKSSASTMYARTQDTNSAMTWAS